MLLGRAGGLRAASRGIEGGAARRPAVPLPDAPRRRSPPGPDGRSGSRKVIDGRRSPPGPAILIDADACPLKAVP